MGEINVKTMAEFAQQGNSPEFLFWVGSAGSFDDRAKRITRSFAKILNKANVSFGVLGSEESSSGDAAKRAGNEFLFQMQALSNIEVLNSYNVSKIVTTCPHSYNTLKNEYSSLGGNYEVFHHSELISDLIIKNIIKVNDELKGMKITFHDPCYLGRGNNIYDEPRRVLRHLGMHLVEMKRSRRKSFCCGAGGSQMFKEPEKGNEDININRTKEALSCNIQFIATACPFCNTMLTDGVKNIDEGSAEVLDIAELIASHIL